MIAHLKKLNKEAILEVAAGMVVAIIFLRLLSMLFGRSVSLFSMEGAEDLENLGGRGRARRTEKRIARRETRAANKGTKMRAAREDGRRMGSAGRIDDGGGEEEDVPSDEEYAEALEMAEYFDSLDAEDIENMDDAEYAEYAEYLEMLDNAA